MQQPILSKVLSDIELRNYSEATKDLYLRTCVRYLEFLGGRPLEATDEFDVRAFSQHLRCDRGLAPKTVNTYLAAVPFMYEVGLDRPMNRRQIPFMHKPKAMPRAFSREEMAAILAAAENVRHRAQISLGYEAGLRISEVCRLRVRDVDSEAMRLLVEDGKGAKDRFTLLPTSTLSLLSRASRLVHAVGRRGELRHPLGHGLVPVPAEGADGGDAGLGLEGAYRGGPGVAVDAEDGRVDHVGPPVPRGAARRLTVVSRHCAAWEAPFQSFQRTSQVRRFGSYRLTVPYAEPDASCSKPGTQGEGASQKCSKTAS